MNRLAISSLCIASALALAACGSSSKGSVASPTTGASTAPVRQAQTTTTLAVPAAVPQACKLVGQAAADNVLGAKLQAGIAVTNPDINSCTYPGDPNGPTAQFEIYASPGAKTYYDDDLNVLKHTFTDVPGLGDESHEEDYNIFFRKGTTWVALRITSLDPWSSFKPRAEALAKNVAAEL